MKLWLWFCFPVICSGELLPSGTQAPWRQGFLLCGSLVYPEGFAGEPGIPSVLRRAFLRKDRSRQHPEKSAIRHRSDKTRWAVLRSCSVFFPSLPRQPLKNRERSVLFPRPFTTPLLYLDSGGARYLWLPPQITTHRGAEHDRNGFSHSSGSQKCQIKVLAELRVLQRL